MQIRFLHSDQGHSTITSTSAFSIVKPAAYMPSPIPSYLKKKIQNLKKKNFSTFTSTLAFIRLSSTKPASYKASISLTCLLKKKISKILF